MNYPQLWRTSGIAFSLVLAALATPSIHAAGHTVRSGETFTSIARKYDISVATLQKANPKVKPGVIQKGQSLNIPSSATKAAPVLAKPAKPVPGKLKAEPVARKAPKPAPAVEKQPRLAAAQPVKRPKGNRITTYSVRSGDTATSLARRSGISVSELAALNNLQDLDLNVGQKLLLPAGTAPSPGPASVVERDHTVDLTPPSRRAPAKTEEAPVRRPAPPSNPPAAQGTYYHVVKRGETMSSIARAKGVSLAELTKANRSIDPDKLPVGKNLNIPGVQVASRQPVEDMIDQAPPARTTAYQLEEADEEESSNLPAEQQVPTIAYRITRNDSAETLAREFNTTPADLRHLNQMGPFDQFTPGSFIRVPWQRTSRQD